MEKNPGSAIDNFCCTLMSKYLKRVASTDEVIEEVKIFFSCWCRRM